MPTSQKRTKTRTAGRFPEILLGICLVAGCLAACGRAGRTDEPADPSAPAAVVQEPADAGADYSALVNHKITVTQDTPLYRKTESGSVQCGTAYAGALLDITAQENGLIAISDSDLYLSGSDAALSERWFRNDTNLVPFAQDVVTKDVFHILDETGRMLAEITESRTLPVYVMPGEENRYGIRFQNGIYYIDSSETEGLAESSRSYEATAGELPVLMYHFFYSEADGGSRIDGNYVEVKELEEQLNYIRENGFHACTMREVRYWMENRAILPAKSIAITIDDADPSVHQYAMPLFAQYGLHATNFVICGWQPPEMSYDLWEMRENGMELQSHGFLTHTGGCSGMGHGGLLLCMDHDAGVEDTVRSFDYVDGGFVYCYPFGDVNDNAESIVKDGGAKLAFTTEGGRINPSMDPLRLPRVRVTGGNGLNAFAAGIS